MRGVLQSAHAEAVVVIADPPDEEVESTGALVVERGDDLVDDEWRLAEVDEAEDARIGGLHDSDTR
jgi:hypothetical protein